MTGAQVQQTAASSTTSTTRGAATRRLDSRPRRGSAGGPAPASSGRWLTQGVALSAQPGASVALKTGATESGRRRGTEGPRPTYLVIEGIEFGRAGSRPVPGLRQPAGREDARPKGPYFVGNLAAFGQLADGSSAHQHDASKSVSGDATLAYDVTKLIETLRSRPGFKGDLKLDFVPKGLVPPKNAPARPESLSPAHEVSFARVKIVRE